MAATRGRFAHGMPSPGCRLLWALLPPLFSLCPAQTEPPGSLGLSLHPPYFNLAETAGISATATCGEEAGGGRPELYCKLVGGPAAAPLGRAIQGQFCDYCNAGDPSKAHPITNAIDGTESWWQSPPLSKGLKYNEVNVTLDLGQLFHVAYILIKFANSPRPDLWILERSVDFGRTYTPWQYFAHSKADCLERFGKEANVPVRRDSDVICTTEYSRIVPLENGEIVVSLVNGRPGAKNFTYSSSLREFTKATNIRLHFLRTNTLLGHLISKAQRDPTVTRRYYYSIKDISIGGRCVCHGHAEVCNAKSAENQYQFHCECQHNTCGETCDRCCPGYNQKQWQPATAGNTNICEPCNCHEHATDCYYDADVDQRRESLNIHGHYEGGGVCINCQHNTAGVNCEKCAKGYYRPYGVPARAPDGCISCPCDLERAEGCEEGSGRCFCKWNFQGENCEHCADGFYSFPFCIHIPVYPSTSPNPRDAIAGDIIVCECNSVGTQPEVCDFLGKCLCRSGVVGLQCDSCQPGHHSFPACEACQCSPHGSRHSICEPTMGQCECQADVTGRQCDRCISPAHNFPYCEGINSECNPSGSTDSHSGYCQCLQHVEGPTCSKCKPLYWNLAEENPEGCTACQCDVSGTLSGVGECQQETGRCYCKSNVCGDFCNTCEAGYYALENENYFGCKGCQCDVGGSISSACAEPLGACQCREHVVGKACQEPEKNYFFPDLHHMKFEIEDGTTVKGKEIRFGYDPEEFPSFSWRGYARMSAIQNEVRITLNVEKSNLYLFRIILRYINPGGESLSGRVSACAAQSKEFVFPPSKEPAFITIPGKNSTESFSLVSGTWTVSIIAEEVLLDYMVLLPRDYYEASILQIQVTEPCTYLAHVSTENCLLYQHLPLDKFSCVLASEAVYFRHGGKHGIPVRQPTPDQPVMSYISGREVRFLHITINVPQVGRYVLVFEYTNEDDQLYTAEVAVNSPGPITEGRVRIYSCKYSFLCRSVVVDDRNRIAAYDLLADTKIHLKASSINFLLHKVCIISAEEFSLEYVNPKVHCIAVYRSTHDRSVTCIPSVYETPPATLILDLIKTRIFHKRNVLLKLFLLLQNQVTMAGRVPRLGKYVFVVHFYQPAHPTFPVHVHVNAGHVWSGSFNASFCPHSSGCRDQVIAGNQIELDISEPEVSVTVMIPDRRMLVLKSVLVVPADNYSYKILDKKTMDKSFDFITQCGGNSFHIDPERSSAFCKDSARSLVAFYNNGAVPCNCHSEGSMSPTCSPLGGQCICRPNVIGRQCSRCQTGYYGFPFCKLCNCGQRLCDDLTGKCICPPRTVKPKCEVCEKHYFGYHPLAGCESCNCSERGVVNAARPECEKNKGQCKCKPGIRGRQCDQCAPGTYGFPNCIPCNCNRDGTEPDVCDPQTGICLCKENVEGAECDICRPGSFYLDPSNPRGCTTCFCFGVTSSCRSTNRRRTKFVDMRNWRLEAMDENIDIPVTFNPVSNSVVADVQELPASVHSLYWKAPPSYLGEKLSSYGGFLSYQVKSFGLPSEGMVLLDKRPEMKLTGQQMKIVYVDPSNPLPDRQYYGRVQLVEGNFRHASSNNLVSREELMIILSRLDALHIRGLYFTETQRLTLGEVGLEETTSTGSGSIAYNVETCSCPPEYAGDSCQECGLGFYRENKGLFTGRCVPCNCNGNSNRCHDGTGKCINCQYNTAGEKCELCKDGYFGDATQGSCRICPCPYTNRFATGCVANGEEIQCLCKEGYTGVRCERCAPGYFGNPQKYGGYCQKCNCNNNGQLASCDRLTGECFNNEPKDVDPNEDCDSCDSCVITLLKDLSTMGDELQLIKSQLQNVRADANTLEQMRQLEIRVKDLKVLLNNHRSVLRNQGSKADELENEFSKLNHDVNALQEKRPNCHLNLLHGVLSCDIAFFFFFLNSVLLEQIAGMNSEGNNLPSGDAAKELAEAQRMMREMRNRNFGQLQTDAEKERTEARLLLARVKNELQKYHQENHGLVKIMRDSLNEYESKLTDLREALNEATGQTKQAENLNRENGVLLEDIKNSILDILSSAQTSLTQANSMLGLLLKSKEEYEGLSAQLDGARKDMNGKLTNGSLSASKEPLVVRAEEHAKSLQDLAKQLEEIKNNARKDELVGCAVEASTAYDNIINAIKAAEEAANKAGSAADSALSTVKREDLSGKAAKLKAESTTLLNQAQDTERTLKESTHAFLCLSDDIDNIITSAKNMVKSAKDVTTNVLDELLPIQEDVEKMKGTYGSTQSAGFNKALTEANNSVKKLTNQLPDLFSKIESINQQLMPISNISENVNRIRELIQQARDAANKVAIPLRFNGSSGVEVRPPSNLEDLKAYTSLTFFLQRPQKRLDAPQRASNKFVLYLGNKDASKGYIGMAVKDGHLTCVYNLGDREAEVVVEPLVMESDTEEAIMDQVKLERIYQYVKLNYIKAATSTSPVFENPLTANSGDGNTLLNLDPSTVVFYVGGYPPDFRPPRKLDYPHYEGCIELDNLNENVISLYNFKRTFNLNTTEVQPCRRYKEESDQSYFEGTGYASVTSKETNANVPIRYEQTIQTTADEGIVFFAANKDQYISVLIKNGHPVFRYKIDSELPKEIENNVTLNDGTYKQQATEFFFLPFPETSFDITVPPFRGCMKNVKNPKTASVVFDETVGVSKKCSDDWKLVRSAAFSKKGTLSLSAASFPFPRDFQVGFGFRTMASTGTLLTLVYLQCNEKIRQSNVSLSIYFIQIHECISLYFFIFHARFFFAVFFRVKLLVDDDLDSKSFDFLRSQTFIQPIRFGGDDFEGCISNVFIERYLPTLIHIQKVGNAVIPPKISSAFHKWSFTGAFLVNRENTAPDKIDICLSMLTFHYRLHFSVDIRTRSSRGLIIFMEGKSENSYTALHISKGRFVFSFGSGRRRIKIKTSVKYNDGQWHTVVCGRDGENVLLVVDGLRAQHGRLGRLARDSTTDIKPPVYLGGPPLLKRQNIPMKSFKGCLRNFKMNGKVMNAPQQKKDVLPCLDAPMEMGIHFFKEGGYFAVGNLQMGLDFRIVFAIRPRSSTGVLLHSGTKPGNYLTIYMKEGKVRTGSGWFFNRVEKELSFTCSFAVSQKMNTVQLEVGTESNYTIGHPPFSPEYVHQPLYFGKIPANLDSQWLPVKDPFFGCLWNISINGKPVSTKRISEVHGAVSLRGCPAT
uniref:Laminin subunit alpha 3 n=1 Tax=Phasianus colchicus TaxID=9054 RepID=A0A669QW11_PHACC